MASDINSQEIQITMRFSCLKFVIEKKLIFNIFFQKELKKNIFRLLLAKMSF